MTDQVRKPRCLFCGVVVEQAEKHVCGGMRGLIKGKTAMIAGAIIAGAVVVILAVALGSGPRELSLVEYGDWCATLYDMGAEGMTWGHAVDAAGKMVKEHRSVAAPHPLKEYHRARTEQMATFHEVMARQPSQEPTDVGVFLVEPSIALAAAQLRAAMDGLPASARDYLEASRC